MAGLPGALRYGLPTPRSRRFRLPVGGLRRVVHPTILASGDHAHADRGMNHGALYGKGLRALGLTLGGKGAERWHSFDTHRRPPPIAFSIIVRRVVCPFRV